MNVEQLEIEKLSSVIKFIQEFNRHRQEKNYDDLQVTESRVLKPLKSQIIQKYVKIMSQKTPRIGKKEFIKALKDCL